MLLFNLSRSLNYWPWFFFAKSCHSNYPRFTKWLHKFFYYYQNSHFVKVEIAIITYTLPWLGPYSNKGYGLKFYPTIIRPTKDSIFNSQPIHYQEVVTACNQATWVTQHPLMHHPKNPLLRFHGWDETIPQMLIYLVSIFFFFFSFFS